MFKLMLNLMVRNADADEMMRLNGEVVDPTKFDPDMDLIINGMVRVESRKGQLF